VPYCAQRHQASHWCIDAVQDPLSSFWKAYSISNHLNFNSQNLLPLQSSYTCTYIRKYRVFALCPSSRILKNTTFRKPIRFWPFPRLSYHLESICVCIIWRSNWKFLGWLCKKLLGLPRCAAKSRKEMEIKRKSRRGGGGGNYVECRKAFEMNYIHRHSSYGKTTVWK
jgi:hypothetical protein